MKKKFSATLSGKSWWKPILGLFASCVAALILFELSWMRFLDKANFAETLINVGIAICAAFPLLVLSGFLAFFAYSRTIDSLSLNDSKFRFRGSFYAFYGDYLKGCLLSLITLGLYLPALIRQTHAYLLHATEYEGHRIAFKGRTNKLFRVFISWLVIPVLAYVGSMFLITRTLAVKPPHGISPETITILYGLCTVLFIAALSPFLFFYSSWRCDFKLGNYRVDLRAKPDTASSIIAVNLVLSALTLGLYLPAAILRIWGYLAGKKLISDGDNQIGKFGFSGNTLRGFVLVWGNALLCVITFGVWVPWGVASIINYLAKNTFATIDK